MGQYIRQSLSSVWLYRKENCHHIWLQKINTNLIRKNKKAYFFVITMGWKYENRQDMILWIYRQAQGLGKEGEAKTNEMNIHTIADLQRYVRLYGLPMLPIWGFGQTYEHGLKDLPSKLTPSIKYHRKSKKPYFLRYGDKWVEKLKSPSSMSKLFCITDLIRFMMKEGEKLMKGSVNEDDLFIVHDDLVLMTAKETITCKWENKYFHIIGFYPWMYCRMGHLILEAW